MAYYRMSAESAQKRIGSMVTLKDMFLEDLRVGRTVHTFHKGDYGKPHPDSDEDEDYPLAIFLMSGNSKTDSDCPTIGSTIPGHNCANCGGCLPDCYDLRNDCLWMTVRRDRARNAAIKEWDSSIYWTYIDVAIQNESEKRNGERFGIRYNVGGDFDNKDFDHVATVARMNPNVEFLFFTKNYDGINSYLDKYEFPSNVHPILSVWKGIPFNPAVDNRHNLPTAHVRYKDGSTTAPIMAYECQGNCSRCMKGIDDGCFTLQMGESVVFNAH